jgi:hypothetical protein
MTNDQTKDSLETSRPDGGTDATSGDAKCPEYIKSGIATDIWLSLVPYPSYPSCIPDKPKLSLRVDGEWRHSYDYDKYVWLSVQSAFCNCSESLEVVVWYDDYTYTIVGLVVRSKYSLTECYREPKPKKDRTKAAQSTS